MPRQSAGLLMYRVRGDQLEVLLVHPGGPFWRRRDEGAWTIPKGEIQHGEAPLAAAIREFGEETSFPAPGPYTPLTAIRQKGGKVVQAWAFEGDCDPTLVKSNETTIEWPPRSSQYRSFPEVDRAAFFDLETARHKINAAQTALLDELLQKLA